MTPMWYMCNNICMSQSGLREARHHLSALIDEVRKGREVEITDRGRVVARLVPPSGSVGKGLPDLKALRTSLRPVSPPLSSLIAADRDDRF
jgi:prevent-host-death family protein